MTLTQAQSLIPGLQGIQARPEEDASALTALAGWCLWLSPLVAPDPPDGLLIDTTGCDLLHGGETAMLRQLADRLAAYGYTTRIALADSRGTAWAMARFGRDDHVVLPSGADPLKSLAALPVAALRLDDDTVTALRRMGLHRVGRLADMPRAPLARRFGVTLIRRLDQARGVVADPIQPVKPASIIEARRSLAEPIGTAEAIGAVIDVLTAEICALLSSRGEGARLLDLLCIRVDGGVQARRVGTSTPVRYAGHLSRLLREQIDRIEPGFGIESMSLRVVRVAPYDPHGQTISLIAQDAVAEEASAEINALIDRLCNRVGPDRVYRLFPNASHLPERQSVYSPVGASAGASTVLMPLQPPSTADQSFLPLRLFAPPEPVIVTRLLPDGPPVQFAWRGMKRRIRAADGPQRIHGEWWRAPAIEDRTRDYWTVEDAEGERFWLYRRGVTIPTFNDDWFLHGIL